MRMTQIINLSKLTPNVQVLKHMVQIESAHRKIDEQVQGGGEHSHPSLCQLTMQIVVI